MNVHQKLDLNIKGYSRVSKRHAIVLEFNGTTIFFNRIHTLNTANYHKNRARPNMVLAKPELLESNTNLQFYTKN
jgi:hypothetical protein